MIYINLFIEDECIVLELLEAFKTQESLKIQPFMSLLYICGYLLLFKQFKDQAAFAALAKYMSLNIGNNLSFCRYISQYFVTRLINEGRLQALDADIDVAVKIVNRNRENMILSKLFEEILGRYRKAQLDLSILVLLKTRFFSERLEIVHEYVVEEFKEVALKASIGQNDDSIIVKPEEACMNALEQIFGEVEKQEEANQDDAIFQRKIDNLLSVYPLHENRPKKKAEIVVVASLVDKTPNLANLTRTCEIFGVKELVIPSKNILKDQGFLKVTVTAERWLPFVECAPESLPKLLQMYQQNGYKVSAAKQDRGLGADVEEQAAVGVPVRREGGAAAG